MWRAFKANAIGGLKRHWADVVIITCLALLSVWVRRLTLAEIEGGGDAIRKWFFVKQWSYATPMSEIAWNHHLARMGINVWAFVAQKLLGTGAAIYYVAPVGIATLAVVFCYKVGQELGGRYAGLISALWFMTIEPMERLGSQLLPESFETAYIAGAAYFLLWYLRYRGSEMRRRVLLALIGLLLFLAYLSKVSNLLFVPGFLLALWFFGGNRRDALYLAGGLLGLFLLETAWYNLFTAHSSRWDIIDQSHRGGIVRGVMRTVKTAGGHGGGGGAARTEKVIKVMALFWKFLERYRVAWESVKFPLFWFLGSSLALAVFAKHKAARAITLVVFVQLFFTTFAVRSLDPLKVWMSNEPRYLIVLCPLLMSMNCAFVVELVRRGKASLSRKWRRWLVFIGPRVAPVWTVGLCALVAWHYETVLGKQFERNNPVREVQRLEAQFSDAYARGLPIVEKRSRFKKGLRLVWSTYLREDLLVRNDSLPSFESAVRRLNSRYEWLPNGPAERADRIVSRQRSCAYVLQMRGRYLRRTPNKELPERCQGGG